VRAEELALLNRVLTVEELLKLSIERAKSSGAVANPSEEHIPSKSPAVAPERK
jgi:hypothetical protein